MVTYQISSSSAGANKDFQFAIFKDATAQTHTVTARRYSSTDTGMGGGQGIVSVAEGDILTLGVMDLTDTTNITLKHVNFALHKL